MVLLGVDRLDYTKGIGQRLRAFQALLDDGTLDPERCVLVQVATPTREGVEQYQDERHEIEQLVGEINGVHGRLGYPVIHYLYQTLPLDELVALYRTADVMLVTPLRDGMNLVAKEYVATRLDGDGVLVLSEFAGAADELTDAVLVNPHDERPLREAIMTAVEMNRHERRQRMARCARSCAAATCRAGPSGSSPTSRRPDATVSGRAPAVDDPAELAATAADAARGRCWSGSTSTACWRRSSRTPNEPSCCPACSTPSPRSPPRTTVAVVSGRSVEDLGRFGFPDDVTSSASTGWSGGPSAPSSWTTTSGPRSTGSPRWPPTPPRRAGDGAWVELKPASVVLHVREADEPTARARPTSCDAQAEDSTAATSSRARGRRAADPRDEQGDGGRAAARGARRRGGVVFVGDDLTDEEVFAGARRRRLLDARRPGRHRRPLPPGRPPRGPGVPRAR